jgi:hypothetical protein
MRSYFLFLVLLALSTFLVSYSFAQQTQDTTGSTSSGTSSGNNSCINGPFSDLRKAWNAAHNLIILNGEYLTIFNVTSKQVGFLEPIGLCVPNANSYPFPSPSSPVVARIIQEGVLKAAQPIPLNESAPEEATYAERIVFYFNQHYKSSVTFEFVLFNSSNECFAALSRNEVDVVGPNFSTGVFIDNVPRTELFAVSCMEFIGAVSMAVSENVTAGNWTEFRDLYISNSTNASTTATPKPKVAATGFGSYLTAVGSLPGFDILFFQDPTDYSNAFNNGTVDVLWDAGTSDFGPGPNGLGLTRSAKLIVTDIVSPTGTFFNYDQC